MKNAVFTIVAGNYIGLAQVLEQSVKKHADADFFIFVADEIDKSVHANDLPANVLIAKYKSGIDEGKWNEMAFKYNLVEFCTAIKPICFQFLFDSEGYEKVIYLDPDVYVFNSLGPSFLLLDDHSIVLTPHILYNETPFKGVYPDNLFLVNGTFNLGFIGLKKSVMATEMLSWWKNRLEYQCFFDNEMGTATDQKWMNLVPALFNAPGLHISRNAGLNLAPWNYHERKIVEERDQLFVTNRIESGAPFKVPLVFVHFSGYDYHSFITGKVEHKAESSTQVEDLLLVFERYAQALKGDFFKRYINIPYTYNFFRNGKIISGIHRRIYRRLISDGAVFADPFDVEPGTFYHGLKKQRLIDNNATSSGDKVTNKTIRGFDKKLKVVNLVFRLIKSLIGIRRYAIMIRFFRRYFREENQVFLYDKNFDGKMW